VSRLVHINFVRKVTGMILDLDSADFNLTISDYELFKAKVGQAAKLLNSTQINTSSSGGASIDSIMVRKSLNLMHS
jgi:hypothetical protein